MSEFNYKQRPATPEWRSNFDLVFGKKRIINEKLEKMVKNTKTAKRRKP